MKRILAHSEQDVQKRRAAFEEHFSIFSGKQMKLEDVKRAVNTELELKYLRAYMGETGKFSNEPNPIVDFTDGKFSFYEQGLRNVLKKRKADLNAFKMEVGPETAKEVNTRMPHYYSLKPFLDLYNKRKDVFTQTCLLTYKGIQMEIIRWFIKSSPFGLYEITPSKEMPTTHQADKLILRDDEFYMLDLSTLLMDLALEWELREEEMTYHAKQMKIQTMEASVVDEEYIDLAPIEEDVIQRIIKECEAAQMTREQTFQRIVQPWMDAIQRYLLLMTSKYKDIILMYNLRLEPPPSGYGSVYPRNAKMSIGQLPQPFFKKQCEREGVASEFFVSEPEYPSYSLTKSRATFKVNDAELVIDEILNSSQPLKDQLTIYPNAKDCRFRLEITGNIGIHALVGYLKQMPELCRKMDKFAESLNF